MPDHRMRRSPVTCLDLRRRQFVILPRRDAYLSRLGFGEPHNRWILTTVLVVASAGRHPKKPLA